jgi:8-oxo-dGTP diphosphatase
MSHEVKIHETQTAILRELLFRPQAGFSDLQKPTGLTSDHFNFHIGRLVELGLVEKVDAGYALTSQGKEYANRLDTDNNTMERQPKSAVLLVIERVQGDREEFLFQERLKQPYFGFWGRPTGKIRWGETIVEAAARELDEETGLAADHRLAGVIHDQVVQDESGELLEDKLFFVVHCTNARGTLKDHFEGGHNEWMTMDEVMAKAPKLFRNFDGRLAIVRNPVAIVEQRLRVPKSEF